MIATGQIEAFAGSASTVDAPFENPAGLCVSGNNLFVVDTGNVSVSRVDLTTHAAPPLVLRRAQ